MVVPKYMPRRYYLEDIALEDAQSRFDAAMERLGGLPTLGSETLPVQAALGRITAAAVWAKISAPHYHAAAMDGVAVQARSTAGATDRTPKQLHIGEHAIWVDTGDPMPADTDAVIMAEHVQTLDEDIIEIRAAVAPWTHVRPMGEDIVATELVLPANHCLRPVDLAALAAAGHATVYVLQKPRVVIIPTGNELVSVERAEQVQPGEIIEFNSLMLAGQVSEWGGDPIRYAPVPDQRPLIQAAVTQAVHEADVVIINAGSSAGSEDYTASVLAELGEVAVHGAAIRPGHPVILAVVQNKPVLGLPGYPVSAALTAELFLQPLLKRMQQQETMPRATVSATISRKLLSPLGEDEFVRVTLGKVDGRLIATPLTRGAGVIMSLVRADGMLRIPRFLEGVHSGQEVIVELLRGMNEIERTIVAIGSHDLALDLLGGFLRGARLSSANVGSLGGLLALGRGEAHLAGTHLLDEATGLYNRPFVERLLPNKDVLLVNLALRDQGFIVAKGNPHNLRSLADLVGSDIRFVNRQKGSGTRVLLDYHLKQHAIEPEQIRGYDHEQFTHMAVAAAVASGAATVGLGIQASATALELDFVPLFQEQYDLAVLRHHWESDVLAPLRDTLANAQFRADVVALGGYDIQYMGKQLV